MKVKIEFVTNSSSASFTIALEHLDPMQIHMIKNHIAFGKLFLMPYCNENDAWSIEIEEGKISGWTSMTNFDMLDFLQGIVKVDRNFIEYDHS